MVQPSLSLFFATVLLLAALPFGKASVPMVSRPQDPQPIMIENPPSDGNPNTSEFSGAYWVGEQQFGLNAYSVASDPYYVPTSDGGWEERVDYMYTDSEIRKPDGSTLSYSARQLDRPSGQDLLYITLGGVTLSFDLITEEVGPVSDSDLAWLEAWLVSQDGHATQDASVALLQQGSQQPDNEALITYYLVAMLLDSDPATQAARKIPDRMQRHVQMNRASLSPSLGASSGLRFTNACYTPATSLTAGASLLKSVSASMPVQCAGCCGVGCMCIPSRNGFSISGPACYDHDHCTSQSGSRFARQCFGKFIRAAAFVFWRF